MTAPRNKTLILNWIFALGLIVLVLNDHLLKWTFSNWITGKLSDFMGMLIFPMFLQYIFPRLSILSCLITGFIFIFWKLPVSDNFIYFYNKITFIPIVRTVDNTDFIALLVLPFTHYIIARIESFKIPKMIELSASPTLFIIPISLIFMATSPPISYYMQAGGDVHIGRSYKMKVSKQTILDKLNSEGFTVKIDTSKRHNYRNSYYIIENVVLGEGIDTIKSIEFGFLGDTSKPILLLNNISLTGEKNLSDWKQLKRYSKFYRKLIKAEIIDDIK